MASTFSKHRPILFTAFYLFRFCLFSLRHIDFLPLFISLPPLPHPFVEVVMWPVRSPNTDLFSPLLSAGASSSGYRLAVVVVGRRPGTGRGGQRRQTSGLRVAAGPLTASLRALRLVLLVKHPVSSLGPHVTGPVHLRVHQSPASAVGVCGGSLRAHHLVLHDPVVVGVVVGLRVLLWVDVSYGQTARLPNGHLWAVG